jgi:hypothetical protein
LECGGKRSATPLSIQIVPATKSKSGVALATTLQTGALNSELGAIAAMKADL